MHSTRQGASLVCANVHKLAAAFSEIQGLVAAADFDIGDTGTEAGAAEAGLSASLTAADLLGFSHNISVISRVYRQECGVRAVPWTWKYLPA